ncbi:MAG: oligosaccharide flippase family protein [Cyclobacteriaceae bacterium]
MKVPKRNQWIKAGAFSIGSRFSILIFGFGSFYFLIRSLSQPEFGAWSLFLGMTAIIEMSKNGLIQNAMIKFLHANPDADSAKVISATWIINLLFSSIIFAILISFSGLLSRVFEVPEIEPMFWYYGITLALLVPYSQFNYIQQSEFSFSGIFLSSIARQGSFFLAILAIFILHVKISIVSLVLIQSFCTFIGLIVAFFSARSFLTFSFKFDWLMLKNIFQFGKYVMGTNLCSLFFKNIDQFSIGYFLNPSAVALYNSALRLSNLIEYPATSVAEVVYPHTTTRIHADGESVSRSIYEKSVGLTLALTVPIVIVTFLFSDFIIYIIAGPKYAASAEILRVTILFGLITPFNRQFGVTMDSSGRPQLNFGLLVFGLIVNIINNIIFIKLFGLIGAAYGTLLSYLIISIAGHFILVRLFNIKFRNIFACMITYYQQGFNFVLELGRKKTGAYDKK